MPSGDIFSLFSKLLLNIGCIVYSIETMDLLSLPDEMLASIFIYNGYHANAVLRKVNRRIDEVVKAYVGTRLQVYELNHQEASKYDARYNPYFAISLNKPPSRRDSLYKEFMRNSYFELEYKAFLTALNNVLSRIIIMDTLTLFPYEMDDDVIDILYRNRHSLRFTKTLTVSSTFKCTSEKTEQLFKCFKNLEVLEIKSEAGNLITGTKVLHGRKWDYIFLRLPSGDVATTYSQFDDQFLVDVVQNCRRFTIQADRKDKFKFSLHAIVKAFETALESDIMPIWIFWVNIPMGNMVMEDFTVIFKDVPNYNISFNSEKPNDDIDLDPIEHKSSVTRHSKSMLAVVICVDPEQL